MYQGTSAGSKIVAGAAVLAAASALTFSVLPVSVADMLPRRDGVPVDSTPVAPARASFSADPSAGAEVPAEAVEGRALPDTRSDDHDSWDHEEIDRTIEFRTREAERIVRTTRIDCPQAGKSLSVMDILCAAARQGWRDTAPYLHTIVDNRGSEARIYHHIVGHDGTDVNRPHVVMEVDEWGELRLRGIHPAAVMNQCYLQ